MTTSDIRPAAKDEDEIDLVELFMALWVGKLWILGAMILALLIGAFAVLRSEPLYQAQGLLQLEAKSGALTLPEGMLELLGSDGTAGKPASEAEMEIMKSRMVMGEAVQVLDLQISARPRPLPLLGLLPARLNLPDSGLGFLRPFQWGNEAISVGELELPQEWLGKILILRITGADSFTLTLPDGSSLEGITRKRATAAEKGVTLMVDRLEGPAGREFLLTRLTLPKAVQYLQNNFSVKETSRNSSILQVGYIAPSPRQAERILDAISQSYVGQNIARSAAEAQSSLSFIEEQLPLAGQAVTEAQNALNAYRQQQQSVDVDYETRSLLERATEIETKLSALALEEEEIKDRFTVNHPVYQALLQNRATLQTQLEDLRGATADLPETQKEIFNLTRNLEVAQQVYVQLLNRQQELRVVKASTVGSVRVIDSAWASDIRVAPRTGRTLAIFLLAGLVIGTGLVLARRMLRRGIRGAEEIEQAGLPVFGTLNYAPDAANHRKRRGVLPIHALIKPDDMVVEALRSLRTALHFGMLDARSKAVLLTSAAPGAGKSFTAVNLAVVAAQAGQRVCLIDADLRRGYLRRYFDKDKHTPGLADHLAKTKTLEEVLLPGPIDGLSVIVTGRFPPNPSELLMRAEFEDLLKALDERFDLVLIDSPPALAVTDPVVIGRYAGATIMVVRHLETMAGEVEAVRRAFETAGSKLAGAVLNGYRQEQGSRYGGYHHYYNYRYSYRSERE